MASLALTKLVADFVLLDGLFAIAFVVAIAANRLTDGGGVWLHAADSWSDQLDTAALQVDENSDFAVTAYASSYALLLLPLTLGSPTQFQPDVRNQIPDAAIHGKLEVLDRPDEQAGILEAKLRAYARRSEMVRPIDLPPAHH